jgi:hypothetical protein
MTASPPSSAGPSFPIPIAPPTFNYWQTILSQYANSPRLTGMIEAFNAAWDQTQNFDNLYDLIWNVLTAQGYGLDVWGRIVGVTRVLSLPSSATYLGFDEAGSSGAWWRAHGAAGMRRCSCVGVCWGQE